MSIYVMPRGGLGNILFTCLIGYSLSKKYHMTLYLNDNYGDKRGNFKQYKMFQNFKSIFLNHDIASKCIYIKEHSFMYQEMPILNNQNNYILDGYFQSYKYSNDIIPDIKNEMILPSRELYDSCRLFYNNLLSNHQDIKTIMLHLRRGDYCALPDYHPVQSDDYFRKSLDIILKSETNYLLLVFSDDIEFVKQWSLLDTFNKVIIDKGTEESFWIMTMCDNYIISNSSFSLLSYYFRDNKDAKLCMPQKWFGPSGLIS
jgi:hypothetical protein